MGGKSCFFIGHREASEEIYPALYAAVEQHILEYGVTEFIVGHYGGFDRLAASAVKEAKRFYPEVKLILLLPYHPAERPTKNRNRESKPLCCGLCRLPHRLCVAPCQQCTGAGGVCKKARKERLS